MILIDAGPLYALVDDHQIQARRALRSFIGTCNDELITTLPALTEAFYLAGKRGGRSMQNMLWRQWQIETFRIAYLADSQTARCYALMNKYADLPMDFADASLVATAESHRIKRIITLDSDFYIYRIHDQEAFDVINPSA